MAIPIEEAFSTIAARRRDELVITSAGTSSEVWWKTTGDTEQTFYLEASMSLSTLFAAGIAMSYPEARVWAFLGDGAFVMNTGMLFVERALALPNLVSIVIANRCYGSVGGVALPGAAEIDVAAVARAAGIARVAEFRTMAALSQDFDAAFGAKEPTLIVLDAALPQKSYGSPPLDGPELKYRFGRALERRFGRTVLA
jgi:sulfopyruvate decarboxylase subunit beta